MTDLILQVTVNNLLTLLGTYRCRLGYSFSDDETLGVLAFSSSFVQFRVQLKCWHFICSLAKTGIFIAPTRDPKVKEIFTQRFPCIFSKWDSECQHKNNAIYSHTRTSCVRTSVLCITAPNFSNWRIWGGPFTHFTAWHLIIFPSRVMQLHEEQFLSLSIFKGIPSLLWKPKVHYRVHGRPTADPIQCLMLQSSTSHLTPVRSI